MASIGDLILALLADGSRLEADVVREAQKAGDAGSKTLGQRLSSGLKDGGMRAFGLAASAAFGIATKGGLELESIQTDIQAATGDTAEEAKKLAAAVNKGAGDNQLALEDVSQAAINVRKDLGAAGDEAADLTVGFARFAKVTKQDAGGAVEDFDDILDAYGLTTKDVAHLQDQLLKSNQEFGGSITDNQKALSGMAPALAALNGDVDDGIALMNLFAASGLDAAAGQKALNAAVKNLPPGTTLDDIVAQLGAIKDPALRAKKAIEIFGSRAGVGLANAIKPGMKSLDDFSVTADEAAGTVATAGAAIDSKWFGIPKLISQAKAALRGFGQDVGPALTGLGAIGSLASTIFPNLGPSLGKKLLAGFRLPVAGLKKIGAKVMATIGLGIAAEAGSGVVGDAIGDAVSGAAKSGKFSAATSKLGEFMGSKLGKGLSIAFALVAWAEVLETYNRIKAELDAQTATNQQHVSEQVAAGTTASLEQSKAALEQGLRDINATWDAGLFTTDARKGMEAQLAEVTTELNRRAAGLGPAAADGIRQGAPAVADAADEVMNAAKGRIRGGSWAAAAAEIPAQIAQGILAARQKPVDAFNTLKDMLKNAMTPMAEVARLHGELTSKALAKGLNSGDPAVRAQAHAVAEAAANRLGELAAGGGKAGRAAMAELDRGMRSKLPAVRAASQAAKAAAVQKLNEAKGPAGDAGEAAGKAFAARLRKAVAAGDFHVNASVGFSLPGKAIGGPVNARSPYVVGERGPEIFVPKTNGRVLTHAQSVRASQPAGMGMGGDTINVNMPVTGVIRAETPADLARPLRQLAATGAISNPRRRQRVEVPTRA